MTFDVDVLIVGAGPAGCAAAIELGKTNLSIAIVDKASFPRDKTCGDALSVDVVNQLGKLSPQLEKDFLEMAEKMDSHGVRIFAPNSRYVDIPFTHRDESRMGFICKRWNFDALMMNHVRRQKNVAIYEGCEVKDVSISHEVVNAVTSLGTFRAKMIIGGDGAHSMLRKKQITQKIDRKHHSAGLRVYYKNVSGFQKGNFIELYFFKDILPGYLWIFPLPHGEANVGIGMLSSALSSKKVNLTKTLDALLHNHPLLKDRFSNANAMETVKGHGLPLGWKQRRISGDRFLLTGDAASLIDPFSGEGVGNAIRSGRVAAVHVNNSFATQDFSASFNRQYDGDIYRRLKKEFAVGNTLLKLCQNTWLFNTIVNKASNNEAIRNVLIESLANPDKKRWLTKPSFYFNLFFRS